MKATLLDGLLLCAALLSAPRSLASASELPSQGSSSAFVAVHGDAVYCVEGPVCSGDAAQDPVGTSCPKKGDMAIDACMKDTLSFAADGQCVAPVDAECRVIPETHTWGCVWSTEDPAEAQDADVALTTAPESSSSSPFSPSTDAIPQAAASSSELQAAPSPTPTPPRLRVVNAAAASGFEATSPPSSESSALVVWIGSVAGVAAVVAAGVVAVVFKQKRRQQPRGELKEVVITPDSTAPATPKLSKTVFVYTAQI